jgi:SAM-dependent methyltransferase
LVQAARENASDSSPEARRSAFVDVLRGLHVPAEEMPFWCDGVDVIGSAYERLLTRGERRDLGQLYTPFWAGRVMAGWLYAEPRSLILDPGCGSGALSIQLASHKARGTCKIIGLDVDPVAVAMANASIRVRSIHDFRVDEANFLLDSFDLVPDGVACNPPYSRHHAIAAHEKAAIHDQIAERTGMRLSRLSALHVLFLVRALEVTSDDARLAFITPSDWLDVNYGRPVKEHLLAHSHIEALIMFEPESLFFDGARTTAAITLIRKGASGPTRVIRLGRELPDPGEVLEAISGGGALDSELVTLSATRKWARQTPARTAVGIRLGDVAQIRRGVATGANSFFVISERRRRQLKLRRRTLKPCVASPRRIPFDEISNESLESLPDEAPRWLVDCSDPTAICAPTALGAYLRAGWLQGVPDGYLASQRTLWHAQEQRDSAPILFSYLNRKRPRFVRNRAGAVPLNNWLIIDPIEGVDIEALYAELCTAEIFDQLLARRRVYGGGLWKLEPNELHELRLPARVNKACGGKLRGGAG